MQPEELIQKLQALDLDPLLLGPLIERIRQEGLTDEVRKQTKAVMADALAEARLEQETLEQALSIVGEGQAAMEAIDTAAQADIDQITQDTEAEIQGVMRPIPAASAGFLPQFATMPPTPPPLPTLPGSPIQPPVVAPSAAVRAPSPPAVLTSDNSVPPSFPSTLSQFSPPTVSPPPAPLAFAPVPDLPPLATMSTTPAPLSTQPPPAPPAKTDDEDWLSLLQKEDDASVAIPAPTVASTAPSQSLSVPPAAPVSAPAPPVVIPDQPAT